MRVKDTHEVAPMRLVPRANANREGLAKRSILNFFHYEALKPFSQHAAAVVFAPMRLKGLALNLSDLARAFAGAK